MTRSPELFTPAPGLGHNALIAGGVVAAHIALLWAVQSSLLRPSPEAIVPVQILGEFITPQPPTDTPAPPPPPPAAARPAPAKRSVAKAPAPMPQAAPPPSAPPAPQAPTGALSAPASEPPATSSTSTASSANTSEAAPSAPAPAHTILPSSNAAYLQNPKPVYPAVSRRLGEQGRVLVRVLIGADGLPQRAEISKSSGHERLDQAALASVLRWKFTPGTRSGIAEAMWSNIPFNWVLE